MEYDLFFWRTLDKMVNDSEIIIDRPKGTTHPKYAHLVYEIDYGYLKGTSSMDGDGIDIWRGTNENQEIDAIICIVDLIKRDSEMKILIGCTELEKSKIHYFHNESEYMKGILIRRNRK